MEETECLGLCVESGDTKHHIHRQAQCFYHRFAEPSRPLRPGRARPPDPRIVHSRHVELTASLRKHEHSCISGNNYIPILLVVLLCFAHGKRLHGTVYIE